MTCTAVSVRDKNTPLWFDEYHYEDCVILDDFRTHWCHYSYLLRLLDKYPMSVPVKGGFRAWRPKVIIVTCMKKPEDLYTWEE